MRVPEMKMARSLRTSIRVPARPVPPLTVFSSQEDKEKIEKIRHENKIDYVLTAVEKSLPKLELLMDRFEISRTDPSRWELLSFCLAVTSVPGFKVVNEKTAHRPKYWDWPRLVMLYFEVAKFQERSGHSAIEVCRRLAKHDQWHGHKITPEALENKFCIAKKSPIVQGFVKMKSAPGATEETFEQMLEALCQAFGRSDS
jgi:hypothetical protein